MKLNHLLAFGLLSLGLLACSDDNSSTSADESSFIESSSSIDIDNEESSSSTKNSSSSSVKQAEDSSSSNAIPDTSSESSGNEVSSSSFEKDPDSVDTKVPEIDGYRQNIFYDEKIHVYPLNDTVTEISVNGVQNHRVLFARANIAKGGKNPEKYVITADNYSYIKEITPANKSTSSTEASKIAPSSNKSFSQSNSLRKARRAPVKKIASAHDYTIPTEPLKQLTKDDIEVGKTKRVFKLDNYRYYSEDKEIVDSPDENYKDEPWIEMEFVAQSVGENSIVWVPASDIDPKTNKPWQCYDSYNNLEIAETTTQITQALANSIRDKFEAIHAFETELYGEKSSLIFSSVTDLDAEETTPTNPTDIKKYTDLANFTNIIIYNFTAVACNDNSEAYFFPEDYYPGYDHFAYPSKFIDGAKSNEGLFLYIRFDSFSDTDPDAEETQQKYGTLAHEYAHALHYTRQNIEKGVKEFGTPLTEMLAQLTEYAVSKKLGIPTSLDIVSKRLRDFMMTYLDVGIMEESKSISLYNMTLVFGVFLLHNYGGQELLSDMFKNGYDGYEAITNAIKTVSGKEVSEEGLMTQFMEALTCHGSPYAENMNQDITFKANGESFTREGINVFNITDHGYAHNGNGVGGKGLSLGLLNPEYAIKDFDLHPDYGFHIGLVNFDNSSDSVSFNIVRNGKRSANEKLYVIIGDKE